MGVVDHEGDRDASAALNKAHLHAARQCLEMWQRDAGPIEVRQDLEIKFRVCYPLVAHAMNQIAVALEVTDGHPLASVTNARVAFEHAVAAQWVLLTHGGEERLVYYMEHQWWTRAREFSEAIGDPDELRDIVAKEPIDGARRSWSVELACRRFSPTSMFYDLYRDLTQAVHPSYGMMRAYLDLSNDAPPQRIDRRGGLDDIDSTAMALGLSGVLALDVLERLRNRHPRLAEIEAIAHAAGLPSELASSDQTPELQRAAGS